LSGPLILHDHRVSDSPNNDCGTVAGRLLHALDAGHVLATFILLTKNGRDKDTLSFYSTWLFSVPSAIQDSRSTFRLPVPLRHHPSINNEIVHNNNNNNNNISSKDSIAGRMVLFDSSSSAQAHLLFRISAWVAARFWISAWVAARSCDAAGNTTSNLATSFTMTIAQITLINNSSTATFNLPIRFLSFLLMPLELLSTSIQIALSLHRSSSNTNPTTKSFATLIAQIISIEDNSNVMNSPLRLHFASPMQIIMSFMFITIISSLQLESYYSSTSLHQSRRSIVILFIKSSEQVPGISIHDLICLSVCLLIICALVPWSASPLVSCSVRRLAAPLHDYQFRSSCRNQSCHHLSETPQQLSCPCPLDKSCLCLCCAVDPVVHRLVPRSACCSVCCSVRSSDPISGAHHMSLQCPGSEAIYLSLVPYSTDDEVRCLSARLASISRPISRPLSHAADNIALVNCPRTDQFPSDDSLSTCSASHPFVALWSILSTLTAARPCYDRLHMVVHLASRWVLRHTSVAPWLISRTTVPTFDSVRPYSTTSCLFPDPSSSNQSLLHGASSGLPLGQLVGSTSAIKILLF